MVLYDFLAPAYDPVFEAIYRPYRTRALELLPKINGATVLDLACGTGQNFPLLSEYAGKQGKIIGVDISSGMLRKARRRVERSGQSNVSLLQADAVDLTHDALKEALAESFLSELLRDSGSPLSPAAKTSTSVDFVVCTYGFSAMRSWEEAFRSSWALLKPGGSYLIHDVDAEKGNFHAFAVEMATRCNFSHKVWRPLQSVCADFRMDYIDPSAHLFGGRLFVAIGTKPS